MSLQSIAPPMASDGTCNCIKEMDERMREKNTRILVTFGLPRDGSPMFVRPLVATEKIETRKRGGACLAIPTYCPFCGVRYEPEPVRPAA